MNAPTHLADSYQLRELSIVVMNGDAVSLLEVLNTIEIYEDMFSKTLHGFVEVIDHGGGLEKFIFSGGEKIRITAAKSPPSNEILFNRSDFVVHKISRANFENTNNLKYRFHFVSEIAVKAAKQRIYTIFEKPKAPFVESIVGNIYDKIKSTGSLLTTFPTPWDNSIYMCPGYTPFQAIDNIARRASKADGRGFDYYVFFERLKPVSGSHCVFSGFTRLAPAMGPETTVIYEPSLTHIVDERSTAVRASKVTIQENFNHLDILSSGLYNSKTTVLDPMQGRYSESFINYAAVHTGDYTKPFKFLKSDNLFLQYGPYDFPGERMVTKTMNNDLMGAKPEWIKHDLYGSIINTTMRLSVVIPGMNNNIGVGSAIKLKLPSLYAKVLNPERNTIRDDIVYSGLYTVTAVRHVLTIKSYVKSVEISRHYNGVNLDQYTAQMTEID